MIPEGPAQGSTALAQHWSYVRCKRTGLRRGWRLYVKARVSQSAVKVMWPHFSSGQDCRRSSCSATGWFGSMMAKVGSRQPPAKVCQVPQGCPSRRVQECLSWPGHPCVLSRVPNGHSSSPQSVSAERCGAKPNQLSLSLVLSDDQSTLLPTSLCGGATGG